MNRFAATLMAIACLLYAAMPLAAAPIGTVTLPSMAMAHDHSNHAMSAQAMDHSDHSGHASKPCPHGSEGCVTPFCAACLVIVPELAFQPLSRVAFSYPAPETAPALMPHGPGLTDPPPRA